MSNCCLVLDKGSSTCCSGDSDESNNLKKKKIYIYIYINYIYNFFLKESHLTWRGV